jgi:hypothetical protein
VSKEPLPDQETDIADNPLLSRIDAELRRASKRSEWVLWVGLGVALIGVFFYERSTWRATWFEISLAALVFGSIAMACIRTVQHKRAVAGRFGLVCTRCGHVPAAHMVMSAAMTLQCEKCRARLPIANHESLRE